MTKFIIEVETANPAARKKLRDELESGLFTEAELEEIDEIATGLINWCFENRGRVPFLDPGDRDAVEAVFERVTGERRYYDVLAIIQDRVDNLATTEFLGDRSLSPSP